MRKIILLIGLIGLTLQCQENIAVNEQNTIEFLAGDGISIKANVYPVEKSNKPIILLFHQAGYSRGEYLEIAPKLNEMGFSCMAIDQRSGNEVNGIVNETHIHAKKANKPTQYTDAITDLKAAIDYTIKNNPSKKIILWGSSYSSALIFILGDECKEHIDGIMSFAPGEYFKYNGKKIEDYATKIEAPVFITSARNEFQNWEHIYNQIPSDKKYKFVPDFKGHHGSKALWEKNEGHQIYWAHVKKFLTSHFDN